MLTTIMTFIPNWRSGAWSGFLAGGGGGRGNSSGLKCMETMMSIIVYFTSMSFRSLVETMFVIKV